MGRGRPRKPTKIKKMEGNRGRRELNEKEPQPKGEIGDPPEGLNEYGCEMWRRVLAYQAKGVITGVDYGALEGYCREYGEMRYCADQRDKVRAEGDQELGLKLSRKVSDCIRVMATVGSKIGLDPVSRTNLSTPDSPDDDDEFFGDGPSVVEVGK